MSGSVFSIFPDPEPWLTLEPEELAGFILGYLNSLPEKEREMLNPHNFSLPQPIGESFRANEKEITRALMEAWVWLEREGFVAPVPGAGARGGWVFITRRGSQIKKPLDLEVYRKTNLLPKQLLHPVIAQKVWPAFIRGDYDTAVFQAFKEVEVAVRDAGGYSPTDIGEKLMRKAFDINNGPLTDQGLPEAERIALQHLFVGAIGSYKNPRSHRNVSITDPTEAVEMIILASHLHRIVDSRSQGLQGAQP